MFSEVRLVVSPRSVALRLEIGPLPARDRFVFAPGLVCDDLVGVSLHTSWWTSFGTVEIRMGGAVGMHDGCIG